MELCYMVLSLFRWCIATIFVILISCLASSLVVAAEPRLECEQPNWDSGTISPTDHVSHLFVLTNSGAGQLIITDVHGCCGAESALSTNVIPSQSAATLFVDLSVLGRLGKIEKTIYVESNDPNQKFLQLEVVGRIEGTIPPLLE
jgi:hypothetical protein